MTTPTPEERDAADRAEILSTLSYNLHQHSPFILPVFTSLQFTISKAMETQGFWDSDNTGEKIALMHSELSEALEADRKSLTSDHIPAFSGIEEELADAVIRILDFAGYHQLRLGEALLAKMEFNLHRAYKHGKKY